MLDDLHKALVATDWPTALEHALAAWRTTRAPELADLIDRITARCTLYVPGKDLPTEQALWWVQHGRGPIPPNALLVGSLLARLDHRADALDAAIDAVRLRWQTAKSNPLTAHLTANNRWPTNFQERCAILLDWEDDPRVAKRIVEIVRSENIPHAYGIPELFDVLADRVGEIGDVRVLPALDLMIAEPRGGHADRRAHQVRFAQHAKGVLEMLRVQVTVALARLPECIALVPPPPAPPKDPPRADLDALWAEVAAHPEDIGIRSVLGDALSLAGDPRGDIIVLQCNSKNPKRPLRGRNRDVYDGRVKTLLRKQWKHWLGDVSLVLPRRACEFRCGMLEVVTVGSSLSPDWAFAKARGHRELACIHTVRPGWVSEAELATFLAALPHFPHTVGATSPQLFEELASLSISLERLTTLELMRHPQVVANGQPPNNWPTGTKLRDALGRIGSLAPNILHVIIREHGVARSLAGFARDLRLVFPKLAKVAVDEPTGVLVRDLVVDGMFEVVPAV
jgi:hypothetical protein